VHTIAFIAALFDGFAIRRKGEARKASDMQEKWKPMIIVQDPV